MFRAHFRQSRDVTEGDLHGVGQQRAKPTTVLLVAHQGQCPGAQAVPAALA